jgi:caffeoyl-CoA O-methyltransferase
MILVPEAIENYAHDHTSAESDLFVRLRDETYAKMRAPQMQVGRVEGGFLKMLARLTRARRILEIGMFTGYSALMMAEGMAEDGRIITCDVDPKAEEMARRYFAESPYGHKIEVRMGPALETIKNLSGPFDMIFIDADKSNYTNYYEATLPLLRTGGLIVADNVLWSGEVTE